MPQTRQTKNYHTFSGGLNSEVSPLTYPDDSVTDISNMELRIDGSVRRRKGLTTETSATFKTVSSYTNGTDAVTEHFWRNVGGDPTLHFHVVQTGLTLHFYTDDATTLVALGSAINLSDFTPSGPPDRGAPVHPQSSL